MQLEFHQLDRRWEHLRVRHPARQRRLLASLAESGQQTPIVVVSADGPADRYVVIDGYKRIAALEQLGRDTVEAVVWPMSEAAAVLLDRSLRLSEHETALEVGWLLAELEQRFGYGLDELARRFDRSVSWVSRRLALVEVLPEAIQQQVREGKIPGQVALKFLVPVARQNLEDCQRMAAIFAQHHCDVREAGQLYAGWHKGSPAVRKRILDDPVLFFKTQRQAQEKASSGEGAELLRDLEMVVAIMNRAQQRLAGAAAMDVDHQQCKAARHQIDSTATRASDGRMTDANVKAIGSMHACIGRTADSARINLYGDILLNGIAFRGNGQCHQAKSDFPERGLNVFNCFLDLANLPSEYVGGLLTTNSMVSLKTLGTETDPRGYTQSSIRIQSQLRRIDEEIQPEKRPHVEPSQTHHDSGTAGAGSEQTRDRAGVGHLPCGSTQSSPRELHRGTGTAPGREGRTLPATDPGTLRQVQGESRASP